jgi:MFS family permease
VQLLNKVSQQPAGTHLGAPRVALTAFFCVMGFIFANWAVRVPAVKQQTGASASALGLALLGMSVGAVTTMLVAGMLCRRFGSRRLTVASCGLLSVTLLLPSLAKSATQLGLALLVFGATYGCMNVAMNSVATEQVAALGRPVMPSFHAAWSFGGLAGAALGGLLAPHLSPLRHLSLITLTGLIVTVVAGRVLLATPDARGDGARAAQWRSAGRTLRAVAAVGLIGLCSAYGEGAIGDWGALHLRQDLHAGAGLAAAGYASFALAEAIGRLSGSTLLGRFGQTRVVVCGGLTACAGALVAALAPSMWLAIAGFAITGLGVANLFPAAMATAGLLAGSAGIAIASTLGYGGFLLGPPSIGFLATAFGLRAGLTTVALLALVAAAAGWATRNSSVASLRGGQLLHPARRRPVAGDGAHNGPLGCRRPARRAAQRFARPCHAAVPAARRHDHHALHLRDPWCHPGRRDQCRGQAGASWAQRRIARGRHERAGPRGREGHRLARTQDRQ